MSTPETILMVYLALNCIVCGSFAIDDHRPVWERALGGVLMALIAFPLVIALPVAQIIKDEVGPLQLKTFWRYLFNRKKLIWDEEQLDSCATIALKYKMSGSIRDRLWRAAARCVFKANGRPFPTHPPQPDNQEQ